MHLVKHMQPKIMHKLHKSIQLHSIELPSQILQMVQHCQLHDY